MKAYELYCDERKVGTYLSWKEMQEEIEKCRKSYHDELGHNSTFRWIIVTL